jgi:hypothetical protein
MADDPRPDISEQMHETVATVFADPPVLATDFGPNHDFQAVVALVPLPAYEAGVASAFTYSIDLPNTGIVPMVMSHTPGLKEMNGLRKLYEFLRDQEVPDEPAAYGLHAQTIRYSTDQDAYVRNTTPRVARRPVFDASTAPGSGTSQTTIPLGDDDDDDRGHTRPIPASARTSDWTVFNNTQKLYIVVNVKRFSAEIAERLEDNVGPELARMMFPLKPGRNVRWLDMSWQAFLIDIKRREPGFVTELFVISRTADVVYSSNILLPTPTLRYHHMLAGSPPTPALFGQRLFEYRMRPNANTLSSVQRILLCKRKR